MQITVSYLGKRHEVDVRERPAVMDILKKMGVNPETVLVRKNGEIVPDTDPVGPGDVLEVLKVVSGG
ncbi:MAG: MoaD/ThiS family protein [Candidatus Aenigmarchaeota archaeon]|nr:MoaD/ThiS family protein [Candidatus Aenigmarchaeota archaeon]